MSNAKRNDRGGGGERMHERLDDLLLERALFGVSAEQESEFEREHAGELRAAVDGALAREYELAAASVALAASVGHMQPMSEQLRSKLHAGAKAYFAARESSSAADAQATPAAAPRQRSTPRLELVRDPQPAPRASTGSSASTTANAGWLVAAAAAVAALFAWWPRPEPAAPAVGELRTQLLARADVAKLDATGQEQFAPGATGDIVWSNAAQSGFIRLVGAPVNDPKVQQYQLWIFDEAQEHPVDGGVFDVSSSGEVLIPIDAKLRVTKPTLFAITIEKPGGVVVSDRQRIAIVAPVS